MTSLNGKVALVTGGASGIGRATALALARAGAQVMISDINAERGELVAAEVGEAARFHACDVTDSLAVASLVMDTMRTFGRLDYAVNNAGVGGDLTPTHRREESVWHQIIAVNLTGVWLCMKHEIPHMLERGGSIVNVSSAAGLIGFRYGSAYAASKHGVIGLTRSAALEYARTGIRVNAVCPGFTQTPMVQHMVDENPKMVEGTLNAIPMRRLGTPEESAQAILWLCSDASAFVTGHALAVDGGTVVA